MRDDDGLQPGENAKSDARSSLKGKAEVRIPEFTQSKPGAGNEPRTRRRKAGISATC